MQKSLFAAALLLGLAVTAMAQPVNGPIIISEIMYNPSNPEPDGEFVEIYNSGGVPADVSGWYLQDEDGATAGIPLGTVIMPNEALVLMPNILTPADFSAAWGTGFQVFALANWGSGGMNNLANGPSATNEVLTLVDMGGVVQDEVNYDDDGTVWPRDNGDHSIFLVSTALDAVSNDNGGNWNTSSVGIAGAINNTQTALLPNLDVASPGVVALGFLPFDHDVSCVQNGPFADVVITISGGSVGSFYYLATAFQNTGVAPGGWFYGIDITYDELITQVGDPVVFTGFITGPTTTTVLSAIAPGCPIGVNIDCVALEFDMTTRLLVQTSAAKSFAL